MLPTVNKHSEIKKITIKLGLPVCLLEPLQGQDEKLGVVFVGQWGERNGREPPTLKPVNSSGVNGYCLFSCDVGTILREERINFDVEMKKNTKFYSKYRCQ